MPLEPSTRVGAYEVVASLGTGGMGEVYRARDTRLGREVALKVLPLSRHDDPELLDRFEREARVLAALNDAHIAAIYDFVTVADHRAIVMELVAGETLTDVLARGPVALRLALKYAVDVSHALSVAHGAGIVHRDLKPGNIMITPAGAAKVLDFGIAKLHAGHQPAGESRTLTANTRPNMALGTPAYMSPEQAHGRPVDARSDIFSLGVVMHEMISGRRAFDGESTAAVLSSVLRDDPPSLRTLVPGTPRAVERCVARCLEKDPARRYQHAADLKVALEDLRDDLETGGRTAATDAGDVPRPAQSRTGWWKAVAAAAVVLIVAVTGFTAGTAFGPASGPRIPRLRPLITEAAAARKPVWSPDGRTLAYMAEVNADLHVFLRGAATGQSTQLTTRPVRAGMLFWSPDGSRLYFTRGDGSFVSVSAGGGEPAVVPIPPSDRDAPRDGTQRVSDACISPDGRTIAFVDRSGETGVRLNVLDLRTGETKAIAPQGLPQPSALIHGLEFSPDGASLAMFASNTALSLARGIWVVTWSSQSARHVFAGAPYLIANPRISWMPDSRRVIFAGRPLEGGASRVLIGDTHTGTLAPLTHGKEDEGDARVSPDGTRIAFVSSRQGLDLIQFPIDGGPPEPVLATSRNEASPDMSRSGGLAYVTDAEGPSTVRVRSGSDGWPRTIVGASAVELERGIQPRDIRLSPDGQRIAVGSVTDEHLIWIYPTAGGTPVRVDPGTTDQHGASWSPDGNWIAYRRMLTDGKWQLAKAPIGGGAVVRLDDTTQGGSPTDWSPSGEWIAYPRPDGLLHLISPDGSSKRTLAGVRSPWFRFSRDSARLFVVRRAGPRWELVTWDVAAAREHAVAPLPLANSASVEGMTLSADGSRIILGVGAPTSDIWLLEEFEQSSRSRWLPW
jgi:Tol biopolymer transport system component